MTAAEVVFTIVVKFPIIVTAGDGASTSPPNQLAKEKATTSNN